MVSRRTAGYRPSFAESNGQQKKLALQINYSQKLHSSNIDVITNKQLKVHCLSRAKNSALYNHNVLLIYQQSYCEKNELLTRTHAPLMHTYMIRHRIYGTYESKCYVVFEL